MPASKAWSPSSHTLTVLLQEVALLLLRSGNTLGRRSILALVREGLVVGLQTADCCNVAENDVHHGLAHPDQGGVTAAIVDPIGAWRLVHDGSEGPAWLRIPSYGHAQG